MLRSIFISIVLVSGVVSFAQNCTTAPCVDFGSQVKATPSQIINGIGYTPVNKAGDTMSGPLNLSTMNNYKFTYSGYPLSQANSDLITAGTGGTIYSNTPVTLNSPFQIGSSSVSNTVRLGQTGYGFLINSGGEIQLCNGSNLMGIGQFTSNSNWSVYVQPSSSIADIIAPCLNDTTQESLALRDIFITNNSSVTGITLNGTIVSGSATITGISSMPVGIGPGNIVTGAAFAPGTLIYQVGSNTITLTQPAIANGTSAVIRGADVHLSALYSGTIVEDTSLIQVGAGYGLLIDGGIYQSGGRAGKPAYADDINLVNYRAWGRANNNSGLPVFSIASFPGTPSGAGVSEINGFGGDVEGCSNGAPLTDINGYSAGNGGGNVENIYQIGVDHEHRGLCNGLRVKDSHLIHYENIEDTANSVPQSGVAVGDLQDASIYLDETYSGSSDMVHVSGRNYNAPATLVDWISAKGASYLTAAVNSGCTSLTIAGPAYGSENSYPMPYTPMRILDGPFSENLFVAGSYAGGNTIPLAGTCAYSHAANTNVLWDPVWLNGGGATGRYTGQLLVSAGNATNDGTGIITVTYPSDPYLYEDMHIGDYVYLYSSTPADEPHFSVGVSRVTGLGQYCTSGGVQSTCQNDQVQISVSDHTSVTNTGLLYIFGRTVFSFDYMAEKDNIFGSHYGTYYHLPEINNSLMLRDTAQPTSLTISNYDTDAHSFYSNLFMGYGKDWGNNSSTDAYLETHCSNNTNNSVACGSLHVRSGQGTGSSSLYLGSGDTDYYTIGSDGKLREMATGNAVFAGTALTPNAGDILNGSGIFANQSGGFPVGWSFTGCQPPATCSNAVITTDVPQNSGSPNTDQVTVSNATGGQTGLATTTSITSGQQYTLLAWIRASGTLTGNAVLDLTDVTSGTHYCSQGALLTPVTSTWTLYTFTCTANTTSSSAIFRVGVYSATNGAVLINYPAILQAGPIVPGSILQATAANGVQASTTALKECGTASFSSSTTSAALSCQWVTSSSHCEATWIGTSVAGGALGYTASSGSVTLTAQNSNSGSASVACSVN